MRTLIHVVEVEPLPYLLSTEVTELLQCNVSVGAGIMNSVLHLTDSIIIALIKDPAQPSHTFDPTNNGNALNQASTT